MTAPGQHGQTRHGGREPESTLNVERRDDLGAEQRRLHDDDDAGRRGVGARLQNAHVQHRLRQLQLTAHIEGHKHDAHGDESQRKHHVRRGSEGGKPVEQAHETHRGQRHRQLVEGRAREVAVVAQQTRGEHHHDDAERRHDGEQRPPAHGINQKARQRRPHRRCEADDEPDDTHGRAALLAGEHQQDDREHHGHDRAGASGLHDAAEQQHPEVRRHGRREAAAVNTDSAVMNSWRVVKRPTR